MAALTRRQVLAGLLGAGAQSGWRPAPAVHPTRSGRRRWRRPDRRGPRTGAVRSYQLTARQVDVDLGGRVVPTWAYGDAVPGTPIRAVSR